jgi:hypothetical protein
MEWEKKSSSSLVAINNCFVLILEWYLKGKLVYAHGLSFFEEYRYSPYSYIYGFDS